MLGFQKQKHIPTFNKLIKLYLFTDVLLTIIHHKLLVVYWFHLPF
jgi:hypothetical protein